MGDEAARPLPWREGLAWLACVATAALAAAMYPSARGGSLTPRDVLCGAVAAATALTLGLGVSKRRALLGTLAVLAVVAHTNVLTFHGRLFVHYHDVAHYYLGTKYYAELDHTDLYDAMLRAEFDLPGGPRQYRQVRNLHSYHLEPAHRAIARGQIVRERFTGERWSAFVEDVGVFRRKLGGLYANLFLDKGFNATPFWVLVASPLTAVVPAGSGPGIAALALIDPVLLALALVLVASTFGLEVALLVVAAFGVTFGASYAWIGGGFFRYGWLACVLSACCALQRRRPHAAGLLLGVATLLRVFPVMVVVPLAGKALAIALERRALPRRQLRLLWAFGATAVVGFLLTALLARGFWHWHDWTVHMGAHAKNLSSNRIGLAELLTYRPGDLVVTWTEFMKLLDDRAAAVRSISLIALAPATVVVAAAARRSTDTAALALGLVLVWASSIVAGYYYSLVVLVVLARRGSPADLAVFFAAEASAHLALRFVPDQRLAFAWHGVASVLVLLWAFRRPLRRTFLPLPGERPFGIPRRARADGPWPS